MLVFGPMTEAHVERVRFWSKRQRNGEVLLAGLDASLTFLGTFCDPELKGERLGTLIADRCTKFGEVPSSPRHTSFRCEIRKPNRSDVELTFGLKLIGGNVDEERKPAQWELFEIPPPS